MAHFRQVCLSEELTFRIDLTYQTLGERLILLLCSTIDTISWAMMAVVIEHVFLCQDFNRNIDITLFERATSLDAASLQIRPDRQDHGQSLPR